MNRVRLVLRTSEDVELLIKCLAEHSGDFYLHSGNDKESVNARSYIGVLYFLMMHNYDTYLVTDQRIPNEINVFRAE